MTLDWPRSVPALTDGTVALRAWDTDDADAVYALASDPVTQSFTSVPSPYTHADVDEFLTSAIASMWPQLRCAAVDANDSVIGSCALRDEDGEAGIVSIGYSVRPDARNHGVATAMTRLLIGYAFEIGAYRVWLTAMTENPASIQVARHCGMRPEGVLRGAHLGNDGGRHDLALWAILRNDPAAAELLV